MTSPVSINTERNISILKADEGHTCWGFSNAFKETLALSDRLGRADLAPDKSEYGTLTVLDKHRQSIQIASTKRPGIAAWFSPSCFGIEGFSTTALLG